MKNALLSLIILSSLLLTGCGNFSPRSPKINNQNGTIEELKNNQNGVMADLEALKNQQDIQNSRLDRIQQGILNLQNIYENSGIQILSGPGGTIVAIIGMGCLTIVVLHYRHKSKEYEKTANILAQKIVSMDDQNIENSIFESAMKQKCEGSVLKVFKRQKALKMAQVDLKKS